MSAIISARNGQATHLSIFQRSTAGTGSLPGLPQRNACAWEDPFAVRVGFYCGGQ
jgi:hypothetical protein